MNYKSSQLKNLIREITKCKNKIYKLVQLAALVMSLRAATGNVSTVTAYISSQTLWSSTCAKSTWTSQAPKSLSSLNRLEDNRAKFKNSAMEQDTRQCWTKVLKEVPVLAKVTSKRYLSPLCLKEMRYEAGLWTLFQTSRQWHKLWHLAKMPQPSTYTRAFMKRLKCNNKRFSLSKKLKRDKRPSTVLPNKKTFEKSKQKLVKLRI